MKIKLFSICSVATLIATSASASHIAETITLTNGWNAIYLESTPTNAVCADFFALSPVARVASYYSDAYSSTRQLADDGTEIAQKPLSYHVWVPGDDTISTMTALSGGRVYMIYTTNAWTKTFYGIPATPQQTYRATAGDDDFMNLVGVSADPATNVTAKAYFGEGPYGTASGSAYKIGGIKSATPSFLSVMGSKVKVQGGKAYAISATKDGEWPGVIGVQGDSVYFGADENFASLTVRNCGTKEREFRFTISNSELASDGELPNCLSRRLPRVDAISPAAWTNVEASASWTVTLGADEMTEQVFKLDRSQIDAAKEYGAILTIEDLGGTAMRVRLPVVISAAQAKAVAYPAGLWVGEIALSMVSQNDDADAIPVEAGGTLRMNVMVHVDTNGTCRLLQRAVMGVDTNGVARLFTDFANVPPEVENPRRISTVMMSVDTNVVTATAASENSDSEFGKDIEFLWTVAPTARDNPFRHAWHPDHDGKKADYSEYLPAGDDASLYVNPVKPELWSIHNRLVFSWHEQGNRATPVYFPYNADETTTGYVVWDVAGLVANKSGMIRSLGVFKLKRVFKAVELE